MMLGSQRIMLDNEVGSRAFSVRDVAPDVLLIGNIGLAQLDEVVGPTRSRLLDSSARMPLRCIPNPLQEAMQHEGDTDFSGSISRLRDIAGSIGYPVILKEVGHRHRCGGRSGVGRLPNRGRRRCGRGGTSWARVEQFVRYGEIRHPALAEWGIPTAEALLEVRHTLPDVSIVASGGIPHRHGRRQGAGDGCRRGGGGAAAAAPAIESLRPLWIGCRFIDDCWSACTAAVRRIWRRCAVRGVTSVTAPQRERTCANRIVGGARDQFLAAHALRDHRGDAVVAHGDAVQRVGDLHRRLLVGDDDQLRLLAQLLEQPDQPAQVDVVERGLDLVHHIER
jgi:isopentenyl-diphosphate delta-isomerase